MSTGQKTTTKRTAGSMLSQSKGGTSVSGGRMVDRWIKGFDAKQATFDTRHTRLLDKLGAAKEFNHAKK